MENIKIVIDQKQNRICITRKILGIIGNPEHILLLVSPDEQTLEVSGIDSSDKRAYRVPPLKENSGRLGSVALCSKALVRNIMKISGGMQENCSYKIGGEFINGENVLRFHIGDFELIS